MLMLTVPKEEYLMIGKNVKITFLGGNNNQLRLMIDAPKEVNIARGRAIQKRAVKRRNAALQQAYAQEESGAEASIEKAEEISAEKAQEA